MSHANGQHPPKPKPALLQGVCGHCQAPMSIQLPPVSIANTMDLTLATVNHPKLITCRVCNGKSTIIGVDATVAMRLQSLSVEEVAVALQQGMIDDTLIEVVKGGNVTSMLRGLKRPQ